MNFRTELSPQESAFKIDYLKRGLMLGSCFVQNIGARMTDIKLPVEVNPVGVIYNPASVVSTLERLASSRLVVDDELFYDGQLWRHYDFHSRFCFPDKAQTLEAMNEAVSSGARALEASDYVILTLGTSRIYTLKSTSQVVCNCHKTPQREFSVERLSVTQIVDMLGGAVDKYLSGKQVIVTVSPIRHLKDGFEENSRSKAALLLACDELCSTRDNVSYFPSYEIVMDDLRDYRFYAKDLVHPSDVAVDYIWEKFSAAMLSADAQATSQRVIKIMQAMNHRPFNPDSASHRAFVEQTRERAEALEREFPTIKF